MALVITLTESVTLDETAGEQNAGPSLPGVEDNDDQDVDPLLLPAGLFAIAGTQASDVIGAAHSVENFITVSATGTVSSLGFVQADGTPLPVYESGDPGVASGLYAIDGGAISLFSVGSRNVYGVDTTGDVVFILYMDANSTLTSASVWMAQFEAMENPDDTDADDVVGLLGLGVAAGESLTFNFDELPSGQNLFGTVGNTSTGLVVIGKTVVVNPATGLFTNASNTINTSQGGGPTTIGVNNQMFDAGDGAYFTFVKNPLETYLAGGLNGLDQNEADDADNIRYQETLEVDNAHVIVSQIQGNALAKMTITAYDTTADNLQGQAFTSALGSGTVVGITAVRVYNAAGTLIEDTGNPLVNSASVTVTGLNGGAITVSGVGAKYKIEWDTADPHDQVLVQGVSGKFDIGGFGTNQPSTVFEPFENIAFEDDGPSITAVVEGAPTPTVDESTLLTDDSDSFVAHFDAEFGADGAGATPVSYALSTAGGDSGLVDTATGAAVYLFMDGLNVVGRVGNDATADIVFVVSVDADGNVSLDQQRAIVHTPDSGPDQFTAMAGTGMVVLTATATDQDGDSDSAELDITTLLVFKDDGPSITLTAAGASLMVDETTLETDDSQSFAGEFDPDFGADGEGATPVSYALSAAAGDSGLDDTESGEAVYLSVEGGDVVGRAGVGGAIVFVVSVDGDGNVSLDQQRAIMHTPDLGPDQSTAMTGTNMVVLTATATDKDGDSTATPLDITTLLVFNDDAPDIGPIPDSIVDFVAGASVTESLDGSVGADVKTAPYTVTDYTATLTINGVSLEGVRSTDQQQVTYYADTDNDTVFGSAGDTAYYRLVLGQEGAGDYTFEVLVTPPPASTTFNFDELPSGQNLFGTVGNTSTGLVVIGKTVVVNPATGLFTNASNTINTSQGGGPTTIGVNNQMFDAGDGAYFTFVKNPLETYLAGGLNGLDQNEADDADNIRYQETLEVDNAHVIVSQIQGNALAKMTITAYDTTADNLQGQAFTSALGSGTVVGITAVRVYNAAGTLIEDTDNPLVNSASVTVTGLNGGAITVSGVGAKYKIEWDTADPHDQVLVQGVSGKFDIGGFGTNQSSPSPDQMLVFEATVTDGDGDTVSDEFAIGIDGTGSADDGEVVGVDAVQAATLVGIGPLVA